MPGLLQTREYAEAANRAALMTATDDEIEKVVAVRMTRQKRLEADDAPQLWAVLNEAVIRRMVGGRAIMRDQILRLIEVSRSPGTLIQVLPFSAGAHPAMDSAFYILGFKEATDGDVVYFEHPTCSLYLEKPAEIARYRLSFDHLRAASHSADESRRLLTRAAEELV